MFVPCRAITDNIIIGHECLHTVKSYTFGLNGMTALKLDLSKAFDRIEWSYLKQIMKKMGFDASWISTIMCCISTVSFSILINGSPRGLFSSSKGIRQGDPLSPYLFLLCAEGLYALINNSNRLGRLTDISFWSNSPCISHLLFADDSLIFLKSLEVECLTIKGLLESYGRVSGQCINLSKSALLFSPNVHPEHQCYLQSIIQVNLVNDFGPYLGLPSYFTRRKGLDWSFLKDKVWKVLQGWKRSFFSVGGKEVLIKSVGQAIPAYAMSVFRLLKGFCVEISQMFAHFWWGTTNNKRKLPLDELGAYVSPKRVRRSEFQRFGTV